MQFPSSSLKLRFCLLDFFCLFELALPVAALPEDEFVLPLFNFIDLAALLNCCMYLFVFLANCMIDECNLSMNTVNGFLDCRILKFHGSVLPSLLSWSKISLKEADAPFLISYIALKIVDTIA